MNTSLKHLLLGSLLLCSVFLFCAESLADRRPSQSDCQDKNLQNYHFCDGGGNSTLKNDSDLNGPLQELCRREIHACDGSPDSEESCKKCVSLFRSRRSMFLEACKRYASERANSSPGTIVPPSAGPSPPQESGGFRHGCGSEADCFRTAAEANRRREEAAQRRRQAFERVLENSREERLSTLTAASAVLERWRQRLNSSPSGISSDDRKRVQNDQSLIQTAYSALPKNHEKTRASFTAEDALRANHPESSR